ncbi:MAG: hypothetical protein IK095_06545 [Oscillospiraceae bacterium]|nr:hypothetical protein [Oscillospiraceae bacterium]
MRTDKLEIERKFLIDMPDPAYLASAGSVTQIEQTYLLRRERGVTERVRKRGREGAWVYTHTCKKRISDVVRIEDEEEIGETEYRELLLQADPSRRAIQKRRWVLPYEGQEIEIDIYPFWDDRAILEIEMERETQQLRFPPQIRIIREVTADRRYSNAALSREIPRDDIQKGRTI